MICEVVEPQWGWVEWAEFRTGRWAPPPRWHRRPAAPGCAWRRPSCGRRGGGKLLGPISGSPSPMLRMQSLQTWPLGRACKTTFDERSFTTEDPRYWHLYLGKVVCLFQSEILLKIKEEKTNIKTYRSSCRSPTVAELHKPTNLSSLFVFSTWDIKGHIWGDFALQTHDPEAEASGPSSHPGLQFVLA